MSDSMLVNAQGEQWRLLRTVISPTFSTGKLKLVCGVYFEPVFKKTYPFFWYFFQFSCRSTLENVFLGNTEESLYPLKLLKVGSFPQIITE